MLFKLLKRKISLEALDFRVSVSSYKYIAVVTYKNYDIFWHFWSLFTLLSISCPSRMVNSASHIGHIAALSLPLAKSTIITLHEPLYKRRGDPFTLAFSPFSGTLWAFEKLNQIQKKRPGLVETFWKVELSKSLPMSTWTIIFYTAMNLSILYFYPQLQRLAFIECVKRLDMRFFRRQGMGSKSTWVCSCRVLWIFSRHRSCREGIFFEIQPMWTCIQYKVRGKFLHSL